MKLNDTERREQLAWANTIDIEQLESWDYDGVYETLDGYSVEPDGKCPHGYSSALLVLGMI